MNAMTMKVLLNIMLMTMIKYKNNNENTTTIPKLITRRCDEEANYKYDA